MSLKIVKTLALDFTRNAPLEYIFVKAGDKNSRVLDITPLNSGLAYVIPEGVKVVFAAKKPDKTEILNDAKVNTKTGHIEVTLSEQTLAAEGILVCEVALYTASDEFLSSQHFYLKASPFALTDVESGNEYNTLVVALLSVDAKVREAEEAIANANAATSAANTATANANAATSRALTAEESALAAAETARNAAASITDHELKKYSVRFSGSASAGTREDDAVGMIAKVAIGAEVVQNDFDSVPFFDRPICCCTWDAAARKWRVNAYKGEPGFAWDGSNGEVMYECTPFYYKAIFEGVGSPTYVSVTATPCEGYELAPLFKNGEDKVYCPCFNMALVDDVAVSRAGLVPYYGSLNAAMEKARKFDAKAHTETIEALFSDALLLWVEFATKNWRSVMYGCGTLVYNTTTRVSSVVSETEFKTTYSGLVAGQNIALGSGEYGTNRHANVEIASVEVDPSDSTLYVVKLVEAAHGLAANDYISSRMYKTGKAALAVTNASSGSPVSNTSGKYPCIWRGKENPWGNGFSTLCNVLSKRYGEEGSYTYKLQYLPDPSKYANGAITEDYIEANFNLATTDGYAKTLGQDTRYPFLFCTSEVGASSTTYIGAYYYYPRYEVGAVRVGGSFPYGGYVGLYFILHYAPSGSYIFYAARLFCSP